MRASSHGASRLHLARIFAVSISIYCLLAPPSRAFNFTTNTTSLQACADVSFTWEGGSPPYGLTILSGDDWPETYDLSVENNSMVDLRRSADGVWTGQWNYTVSFAPGSEVVVFMSDSSGIGIMRIDNATDPLFSCWTSKSLPQGYDWMTMTNAQSQSGHDAESCEPLTISWSTPYSQTQPDLILGVNPPQVLFFSADGSGNGSSSSREIIWDVDVLPGSRVILQGYDTYTGGGAIGRASPWTNITENSKGDTSCLDYLNAAPDSVMVDGGLNATETSISPVRTVTATLVVSPPGTGMSVGQIVGLVFGILAALLIVQVAFYFLCWKKRIRRAEKGYGGVGAQEGEKDPRRLSRIRTASDLDHVRYEPFPSTVNLDTSTACIPSPENSVRAYDSPRGAGPFGDAAAAVDPDADANAEVMSAMAEYDKASIRSMPLTERGGNEHDAHEPAHTGTWTSTTTDTGTRLHTPAASTADAGKPIQRSPIDPFGDTMVPAQAALVRESLAAKPRPAVDRPTPARLPTARSRRRQAASSPLTPTPIYIHEDAGRVPRVQADNEGDSPVQEELPPRYDPDWRYEGH